MTRARSGSRGSAHWRAAAHAALLVGAGMIAPPVAAGPAVQSRAFAPPSGRPLILARTVVRELPGGAAIVATRRYRVTFQPVSGGWEVDGALVSSEIDVPPALAALAAIERARPDDGMFPIVLDHAGRIVAEPVAGMGREAVAGAVGAAGPIVGPEPATGFIVQIGAAAAAPGGGLTSWPEALFLPGGMSGTTEQAFALPDGSAGTVRVSLECDPAPGMAMMGRAARTVVTHAAGTRRVAREEWTLAADEKPARP